MSSADASDLGAANADMVSERGADGQTVGPRL
jgi:hypothetical protein